MTVTTKDLAPVQVYSLRCVKLVDNVPMLERKRTEAKEWLKQWTPARNFMHIVCANSVEAAQAYRAEIKQAVEHHGYPAANFEFSMMHHPVKIAEDGTQRFWVEAFISSDLEDLPVVPERETAQ